MQETSKAMYAALQELHQHVAKEPAALLLLTQLERDARAVYEYFLRCRPDERPVVQNALDAALERTIQLEQRVLDVEHELHRADALLRGEQQRSALLEGQSAQLRQALTQFERINAQNAESARAWRARSAAMEAEGATLRESLGEQLRRVVRENERLKRRLAASEAKNAQADADLEAARQAAEHRARCVRDEAAAAAAASVQRIQLENAQLSGRVAQLSASLGARQNEQNEQAQHTGASTRVSEASPRVQAAPRESAHSSAYNNTQSSGKRPNPQAMQNGANNGRAAANTTQNTSQNTYSPGKYVKAALEESDSSQFVQDIGDALQRMRREQLFVQRQLGPALPTPVHETRVDAGLALISERLKRLENGAPPRNNV